MGYMCTLILGGGIVYAGYDTLGWMFWLGKLVIHFGWMENTVYVRKIRQLED